MYELVSGLNSDTYAKMVKALRTKRPVPSPDHFRLLSHLYRCGPDQIDQCDGLSLAYRARLPQNRHQLFKMVCDALIEAEDPSTIGRGLRRELEIALLLRHCGHLHQSLDWFHKAQRRATDACDHTLVLECLDMERIVLKDIAGTQKEQEDNRSAIRAALGTLSAVAELRMLADEMLSISRGGQPIEGTPAMVRAKEMSEHRLLNDERTDMSFKARSYRLTFLSMYHRWLGNVPLALKFSEQHIRLWDLHPEMVQHMPQVYVSAVSNALSYYLTLGHSEKWSELRPRFDHKALNTGALKADMFRAIERTYLLHRLKTNDFDGITADRPRLLRELERFEKHLPPSFIMAMKSNLGMHAWLMDDRRTARRILLDVMDGPHRLSRPEAMYMATLVIALMDFDKGLMESEDMKRLRKKLAQYPKADALTALVMAQLPQLAEHARGAEKEQQLHLAQTELAEWARTHRGVPGTDEYCLWLLHRCTGRPMFDLYLEKAHHRLLGIE